MKAQGDMLYPLGQESKVPDEMEKKKDKQKKWFIYEGKLLSNH